MMNDEPKNEGEVTPEGAVEVNEEDLDQASGGLNFTKPGNIAPDYIDKFGNNLAGQKLNPTDLAGAGPGAGPHVVPEKKI